MKAVFRGCSRSRIRCPNFHRASTNGISVPSLQAAIDASLFGARTHKYPLELKGTNFDAQSIYMDYQATTPLDFRVLDAMLPYQTESYGNPHSSTHMYGWETDKAIEEARGHVASLMNANPKEIVFTSGATESNNTSIKGVARFAARNKKNPKKHIITVQTEHKCVIDSARVLQLEGFDVTFLPVEKNGIVNLQSVRDAIRDDTALLSVMLVNNEIGVIQPVKEIAEICRERGVKVHCDAAQALGKIPVDVEDLGVDLMSLSAHKIYGPRGVGALYTRRRPRVKLEPLFSGGGQERGLRSGTLPPALCIGFGKACQLASELMEQDTAHVSAMTERLYDGITSALTHVELNGDRKLRYAGNLNLSFAGVEGESLLMGMKALAISSGSACTSASLEPSYVLKALGVQEDMAHTSLRFGIGRFTTERDVDAAIKLTIDNVTRLRELSATWEMIEEGIDLNAIQWDSH